VTFFKIRSARKELKEVLHHARHVRHMQEDICNPKLLAELQQAETLAKAARKGSDLDAMERAGTVVCGLCDKIAPPRLHAKVRENVEVLFVAIAAAMAIRAYFFQPFKIPTGSMQPTLYGIEVREVTEGESVALPVRMAKFFWKGEVFLGADTFFDRIAKFIAVGKGYSEKATVDGMIQMRPDGMPAFFDNHDGGKTVKILVGNTPHVVSAASAQYCRFGEHIKKGESLLRGIAKAGDYILVNRMIYNFFPPKRGDIVVFDAEEATGNAAYYIKRMVGLPGETISVEKPYLKVNGETPTDPRFDKLFNNTNYCGYVYGTFGAQMDPQIAKAGDTIELKDDEYLFFGDNTENSLDGRYFGGVKREHLLGTAFFVGLPFDRAGWAETVH
jgi:signal peptidase I